MTAADCAASGAAPTDIPGTTVFDGGRCRDGYHLNMCCMSFNKAQNRAAFQADERAYLEKFPITAAQREAVLARDYNRLLGLGGNIYFLGKIAAIDGDTFQKLASRMSGVTEPEFRAMMIAGGRSVDSEVRVPEFHEPRSPGSGSGPESGPREKSRG